MGPMAPPALRTAAAAAVVMGAALVGLAPTPGPAAATSAAAPTYARAHTAYLVGAMLYLPTGEAVHLPIRERHAPTTNLLGSTASGWVLGVHRDFRAYAGATLTDLGPRPLEEVHRQELLSSDGTRVVSAWIDEEDGVHAMVVGLDGSAVELPVVTNTRGGLSAAVEDRVYVAGASGIDELVVGEPEPRRLTTLVTDLVDPAHEVAFVRPGGVRKAGPAPFDATAEPAVGAPSWLARFRAVRVSADGTRVLGSGPVDGTRRLQVRRMGDGALLASFPMPDRNSASDVVGWDGDGASAVLAVVAVGDRRVLTRCSVRLGTCARVTPPTAAPITLPTAVGGVRTYP